MPELGNAWLHVRFWHCWWYKDQPSVTPPILCNSSRLSYCLKLLDFCTRLRSLPGLCALFERKEPKSEAAPLANLSLPPEVLWPRGTRPNLAAPLTPFLECCCAFFSSRRRCRVSGFGLQKPNCNVVLCHQSHTLYVTTTSSCQRELTEA